MKKLKDMSLEELWRLFPIILKEHNAEYAAWYEEEEEKLLHVLKEHSIYRVSHVGSTAVQGMIAKPIIDILLELPEAYDMDAVAALLQNNAWHVMARNDAQKTIDLNKGYTPDGFAEKVYHLHVKPTGDWGELYFRDYLRQHPDIGQQYEALKLRLKMQFECDRDAYTIAKSDFIMTYTQMARQEFAGRHAPHS